MHLHCPTSKHKEKTYWDESVQVITCREVNLDALFKAMRTAVEATSEGLDLEPEFGARREVIPSTSKRRCIGEIAGCHLTMRRTSMIDQIRYNLTRLDDRQNRLVDALRGADRMSDLKLLRTRIQPRAPSSL